jgi:hypothetical protein
MTRSDLNDRKELPECNGGTCAFKVIAQGHAIEECDVHNHYFKDDHYAVNEAGIRMHDDASLLPTESKEGDFPSNVFRCACAFLQDPCRHRRANSASQEQHDPYLFLPCLPFRRLHHYKTKDAAIDPKPLS